MWMKERQAELPAAKSDSKGDSAEELCHEDPKGECADAGCPVSSVGAFDESFKKKLRKERNRITAKQSRQRRTAYVQQLEESLKLANLRISELELVVQAQAEERRRNMAEKAFEFEQRLWDIRRQAKDAALEQERKANERIAELENELATARAMSLCDAFFSSPVEKEPMLDE